MSIGHAPRSYAQSCLQPDDGPVLVTGGAGFIGTHLVRRLDALGYGVRVLELPGVVTSHLPRGVEVIRGSITEPAQIAPAVAGCAAVAHVAGDPNLYAADADRFEQVNHQGTRHVLAAAASAGVRRVLHVSTESILADADPDATVDESAQPSLSAMHGAYLKSKWRAEAAARAAADAGQPVMIVNPSIPVGPGDRTGGPLTRLIRQFAAGRIRAYLPGTINVIDVRDLAVGLASALERGAAGSRYLIAGHNLTYRAFFEALAAVCDRPAPRWTVPYPLALAFAHLEEAWCRWISGATPMATVTGVRLTRRSFRFDASASHAQLGWPRRPLTESLRDALACVDPAFAGAAAARSRSDADAVAAPADARS